MAKIIKKLAVLFVLSLAIISTYGNSTADAASWSLYGTPSGCSKGCGYVTSTGTITNYVVTGVKYNGYASTVWPGGYGKNVTLYVAATATTGYLNGSNTVWADNETRVTDGLNQVLVSVPVVATHTGYFATNATVTVRGTISSDWFYYSMSATGNNGV